MLNVLSDRCKVIEETNLVEDRLQLSLSYASAWPDYLLKGISLKTFTRKPLHDTIKENVHEKATRFDYPLVSALIQWSCLNAHPTTIFDEVQQYADEHTRLEREHKYRESNYSGHSNYIVISDLANTVKAKINNFQCDDRTITPEKINAAIDILSSAPSGYAGASAIAHYHEIVNRTVAFLAEETVHYTTLKLSYEHKVRGMRIAVGPDTVWVVQPDYARESEQDVMCSLLVSFILFKHNGADPFNALTHIGVFDPYRNVTHTRDMRTLHPAIYNFVINTLYS